MRITLVLVWILLLFFSCSSIEEKINEAAYEGDIETVEKGISKKTTINFQDERGWTPLMAAVEGNHLEVVKKLIQKGAYIDIRNTYGDTALMRAVYLKNKKMVSLLLESGADPAIRDNKGYTPFLRACEKGSLEIAMILVRDKIDFKDRVYDSIKKAPLHLAVYKENIDLLEWLYTNGSELNAKTEDGRTPLMYALIDKKKAAIKFYISKGASKSDVSSYGENINSLAKQTMDSDIISHLNNFNPERNKETKK